MKKPFLTKLPFILLVLGSLISGIFTGWFRLGLDVPVSKVYLHHGAMMTGSFLGTVILIERITALKRNWLFAFPLINASSLLFFYVDLRSVAFMCLVIGSLGLNYIFYLIKKRHSDLPHQIMWVGAGAWVVGNLFLLIFEFYAYTILWWMAFLLFTIVGERLELSKFLPVNKIKQYVLVAFLAIFLISCMVPFHKGGQILLGLSLILIALWLLMFDMVKNSIRMPGIHRFTAFALIFGYIWLAICGSFYLFPANSFNSYDAQIHSFFLGFIFSMIFAHAPIILPGVLRLSIKPYHFTLYIWVIMLQISLALRVFAEISNLQSLKMYSGLANGIVIFLFIINLLTVTLILKTSNSKFGKFI